MEGKAKRCKMESRRLFDAALEGDVACLLNLLQTDPLILDRCIIEKSGEFNQSPLHVAAELGHLNFAKEVLVRKPELAEEADQSKRWSPLHMASAKGYLEIVKELLEVNCNMCFARDQDGRNPIHIAAINGQHHVFNHLFQANPQAALERTTTGGETVLHLCVKHHHQTAALTFLPDAADDRELLNSRDADGNTVLHLAVAAKQPKVVQFLLNNTRMERNIINANGSTAMDVFIKSRKDENYSREIWKLLKLAKELPAKDALKPRNRDNPKLKNHRSGLLVVASLIATMAFQVGTNPPGGTWQDSKPNPPASGAAFQSSIANPQEARCNSAKLPLPEELRNTTKRAMLQAIP